MAKFILRWQEEVVQFWELEVEAKNKKEAENIYHDGDHITGDEYLDETLFLESSFTEVVKATKVKK